MLARVRRFLDIRPGETLPVLATFIYIAVVIAAPIGFTEKIIQLTRTRLCLEQLSDHDDALVVLTPIQFGIHPGRAVRADCSTMAVRAGNIRVGLRLDFGSALVQRVQPLLGRGMRRHIRRRFRAIWIGALLLADIFPEEGTLSRIVTPGDRQFEAVSVRLAFLVARV